MFTSPHAKMRFVERVKKCGLPKNNKKRVTFIEDYIKRAYKLGLTPKEINDTYLRDYMYSKLKRNNHEVIITKITCYKDNLFLFHNATCVTILELPDKAKSSINKAVYATNLKSFINMLNENKAVKKWLTENASHLENGNTLNRCVIRKLKNINYNYVLNNIPLNSIIYIKNPESIKKIIINNNNNREENIKMLYYFISALILLLPKKQIMKLQNKLKNNKQSVFTIINNKGFTQKQLDVCYKQLFIMLNGNITPKYKKFNVDDNKCFDLINDYITNVIFNYIEKIKHIYETK